MKNVLIFIGLLLLSNIIYGQKNYFSNPVDGFSKKKTSYVTLTDGTELVGKLKKLDRKKGLFEGIQLIVDDKKHKLDAEDIKYMYLYPSGLNKLVAAYDLTDNEAKVADHSMNSELIKDGYVYFEQTECYYKKKKKQTLLLQLLNAGFSNSVKVFHDPLAKESMGLGVGGFKVAGGNEKSYFVKKGADVAFKLKKKNYDEEAEMLFGDCKGFFSSIKDQLDWGKLGKHVIGYSTECK